MTENSLNSKSLLRKILLSAWVLVCTAIFVYFLWVYIYSIVALSDNVKSDPLIIDIFIRYIFQFFFTIILYASFAILALPKTISALTGKTIIFPYKAMRNPHLSKILLLAWVAACAAIFAYFVYFLINSITFARHMILTHTSIEDAHIVEDMKNAIISNTLVLIFITTLFASYLALVIPKAIKAFRPSTIEHGKDIPAL